MKYHRNEYMEKFILNVCNFSCEVSLTSGIFNYDRLRGSFLSNTAMVDVVGKHE